MILYAVKILEGVLPNVMADFVQKTIHYIFNKSRNLRPCYSYTTINNRFRNQLLLNLPNQILLNLPDIIRGKGDIIFAPSPHCRWRGRRGGANEHVLLQQPCRPPHLKRPAPAPPPLPLLLRNTSPWCPQTHPMSPRSKRWKYVSNLCSPCLEMVTL